MQEQRSLSRKQRYNTSILQVPDFWDAIEFYMQHLFSIPLVIADLRPTHSSGFRFWYTIDDIEKPRLTRVVSPYTVRTRESTTYETKEINPENLAQTTVLNLRDARLVRKISRKLMRGDLKSIAIQRNIMLEHRLFDNLSYLLSTLEDGAKANKLLNSPRVVLINLIGRYLEAGDRGRAQILWGILKERLHEGYKKDALTGDDVLMWTEEALTADDITIWGYDQSSSGGLVTPNLMSYLPKDGI